VNLDPDVVQTRLRDAVAALVRRHDDPWHRLAELGLFRLDLPLAAAGLDLGVAASVVAGIELGQAMQPLAGYRETVFAAHLLHAAGHPESLVAAGSGERRIATVGFPADGRIRIDTDGLLWGTSRPLPDAPWDSAVVQASGPTGTALALVDIGTAGCAPVRSAEPATRLCFTGAAATRLPGPADVEVDRHLGAAFLRHAAFLVGLAAAALALATDHCQRRHQFGRPLIDFQTVGHRLAATAAEADGLVLLVHEAAWRHDAGLPDGPYAAQAAAAAAEHALAATRLAVQLHGARGIVAGDAPDIGYRLAARESTRLGTPQALWRLAGLRRLAPDHPARSAANRVNRLSGGSRNV
jgi:alkylation response protein AidB-like acyl-CoA dehydrogenase